MKLRDLIDLTLLAAMWGASFLFMRVAVPAFGPLPLAFLRVAGATAVLLPLVWLKGQQHDLRRYAGALCVLGLSNSALPFVLYAFAALTLPGGLAAIFNATTPLSTALIGRLWLGQRLTRWQVAGLLLGFVGVVGLALHKSMQGSAAAGWHWDATTGLAVAACLLATLLYGYSGNHTRRYLPQAPALVTAGGLQLAAALALAVPAAWAWPAVQPGLVAWLMAAALAVLCSGVAYILYFRLIARVGPTRAASVTFLTPAFATLWGGWFLDEALTLPMLLGGGVIVAGTALVLGLLPRSTPAA